MLTIYYLNVPCFSSCFSRSIQYGTFLSMRHLKLQFIFEEKCHIFFTSLKLFDILIQKSGSYFIFLVKLNNCMLLAKLFISIWYCLQELLFLFSEILVMALGRLLYSFD